MARSAKALTLAGMTASALALLAVPADAHVTVSPNTATQGGYATLTFKVPNERPNANTKVLAVEFPAAYPFASISVQPKDGWTYKVEKAKLDTPIDNHGQQVDERVERITWTAKSTDNEIKPGEFDVFPVSAGPLPTTTDALAFKALQTYSNGEVVRWIEEAAPGAEEPRFPAPTLTLTAAEPAAGATPTTEPQTEQTSASDDLPSKNQVNLAIGLSVVALILTLIGVPAAAMSKRR
jgi:uncharacterized protein